MDPHSSMSSSERAPKSFGSSTPRILTEPGLEKIVTPTMLLLADVPKDFGTRSEVRQTGGSDDTSVQHHLMGIRVEKPLSVLKISIRSRVETTINKSPEFNEKDRNDLVPQAGLGDGVVMEYTFHNVVTGVIKLNKTRLHADWRISITAIPDPKSESGNVGAIIRVTKTKKWLKAIERIIGCETL